MSDIGHPVILAVVCQNCGMRPATITTTETINGQRVYVNLCEVCFSQLRENAGRTSYLDRFGRDLTKLAEEGKLDPVIGRENEIGRVIHILSRRTKNNPVLIGDPGVGKTAIVEGLAQRIIDAQIPEILQGKRVVALDIASIVAGTVHRGQFEERLKKVIEEVTNAKGQIILFVDELHTVVGAGAAQGAIDAANILKPSLARGELQMVGATTIDEYRKYVEKDAALERRFQPILVNEPTLEETIAILKGLRPRYEKHHQVAITDEALVTAAKMSDRYVSDRFLPDKAIDLVDEAAAEVRLDQVKEPENLKQVKKEIEELDQKTNEAPLEERQILRAKKEQLLNVQKELTDLWAKTKLENVPKVIRSDILKVIAQATGIPLEDLSLEEKHRLQNLEEMLHKRIVDQDEAVSIVANAIRRARAGLKDPNRPIGAFIFLGPTGVGKTELTKALAEVLYGSEEMMVRLDMSEYMERHTVSKMVGAPPGYIGYEEGGQLTEIVRRKPFSVILLDEIEKAHPDVFNMLLQIMEDGRLTDAQGRVVDFKNTIIIMTSNLGTELARQAELGFGNGKKSSVKSYEELKRELTDNLRQSFRPEFLNRVDEIVVFKTLGEKEVRQIVDLEIEKLKKRLLEQGISLEISRKACEWLTKEGFSEEYGARPIKRLIQREVENRISDRVISGELSSGRKVEIDFAKSSLVFREADL